MSGSMTEPEFMRSEAISDSLHDQPIALWSEMEESRKFTLTMLRGGRPLWHRSHTT
jgi:hypothetical protein